MIYSTWANLTRKERPPSNKRLKVLRSSVVFNILPKKSRPSWLPEKRMNQPHIKRRIMIENLQSIKPGTGLGILKFGMSREQAKELLGEPDEIEKYSYTEEEEEWTEAWHYDTLELSLGFDEVDDWKLTTLSVTSKFYELKNKKLIGLNKDEIISFLEEMDIDDYELEDWSSDESPGHELIVSEDSGLNFWFDEDTLHEIEWGPIWLDDNTFRWPA